MKTDLKKLAETITTAVDTLKQDAAGEEFSPQLGIALGGLRTAQAGLEAHLKPRAPKAEPKQP